MRSKQTTSLEGCSVEFKREASDSPRSTRWRGFRTFFQRAINTFWLIKKRELREPLSKKVCPFRWLHEFPTFFFNMNVITSPEIMKAMLKHARRDPENGLFDDRGNLEVYPPILNDLYPGENFCGDDMITACHKDFTQMYRQPLLQFLGSKNIKKHESEILEIAQKTVEGLAVGERVNGTKMAQSFAVLVISKLLLGHPGPADIYSQISHAVNLLNHSAIKKAWKIPFSKKEKAEYEEALRVVRKAIETAMTSLERPCLGSLVDQLKSDGKLSQKQLKAMLFIMYFAGSETTASLLSYLLWQLGKHPEYQERIAMEIQGAENLAEAAIGSQTLNKVFVESIRLYTPAYIINRETADDLVCIVKDKEGSVLSRKEFAKGDMLLAGATFAGRDPQQYENPDIFDPDRFQTAPHYLPWIPFGEGMHSCPGQWLAKTEILLFTAALLQRYRIQSFPNAEMKLKGYMTLKTDEDVELVLSDCHTETT